MIVKTDCETDGFFFYSTNQERDTGRPGQLLLRGHQQRRHGREQGPGGAARGRRLGRAGPGEL